MDWTGSGLFPVVSSGTSIKDVNLTSTPVPDSWCKTELNTSLFSWKFQYCLQNEAQTAEGVLIPAYLGPLIQLTARKITAILTERYCWTGCIDSHESRLISCCPNKKHLLYDVYRWKSLDTQLLLNVFCAESGAIWRRDAEIRNKRIRFHAITRIGAMKLRPTTQTRQKQVRVQWLHRMHSSKFRHMFATICHNVS